MKGLYDNLPLQRRELWIEWEGEQLFYGWCSSIKFMDGNGKCLSALERAGSESIWKSKIPFGSFIAEK